MERPSGDTEIEQQYQQMVDQAQQTAANAAESTASVISTGALAAFVALVLGAAAGWFGGRSGVVHPVYADGVVHPVYADGVVPRRRNPA